MAIISFIAFTLIVAIVSYDATRKTDESTSEGFFLGGPEVDDTIFPKEFIIDYIKMYQT